MPKFRTDPLPLNRSGTGRISITVTPEQSAIIDAARGSIPASVWVRDAALRAAAK